MSDNLTAATLAMTQGIASFQAFMPRVSDIRKEANTSSSDIAFDVRAGEVAAVTTTLSVGVLVSALTKTPIAAYVSLITCLVMVVLYESLLRSGAFMKGEYNA